MELMVSVIVPVYNVELYLNQCISSIVNQTYRKIEIILVDDGSTDTCYDLCEEWKERDERIIVIHKSNQGLGLARNTGLEVASGDYVSFIDSDDFVNASFVEKLITKAIQTSADTVYCNFYRYLAEDKIYEVKSCYNDQLFCGKDVYQNVMMEMIGSLPSCNEDRYFPMSSCLSIYSMELINKYEIRFISERLVMCEDILFNVDYLKVAKKVACIDECLYFYRLNSNSLSQSFNAGRFEKGKLLNYELNNRLSQFLDRDQYILRTQRMFLGVVRHCIRAAVNEKSINSSSELRKYCRDLIVVEILNEYPINQSPIIHRIFNTMVKNESVQLLKVIVGFERLRQIYKTWQKR